MARSLDSRQRLEKRGTRHGKGSRRNQRIRAHRTQLLPRASASGAATSRSSRRTISATRRRWRTCSSTTRSSARSAEDVEVGDGTIVAAGQRDQDARRARPGRAAVGRARRRRRARVDRIVHGSASDAAEAHRRRREEGRHLGAGGRPGPDRRPRCERRGVRPGRPPHRLERLVHDQLRRAAGEGHPRRLRDRAGLHDDDPRVHERPAASSTCRTRTCAGPGRRRST